MRLLKLTALAIAFISPAIAHAATDGTLGPTSTGTFGATLTINDSNVTHVQIVGLDDIAFGTIDANAGAIQNPLASGDSWVCLKRSNPGLVRLTVSQTIAGVPGFGMISSIDSNGDGSLDRVPIALLLTDVAGRREEILANGEALPPFAPSPASCTTASSGTTNAHKLVLVLPAQNDALPGNYSATFVALLAPD